MKKNYCILGVTNDEFELPLACYYDYFDMSLSLDISYCLARKIVSNGFVYRKTGLKYIKVWFYD